MRRAASSRASSACACATDAGRGQQGAGVGVGDQGKGSYFLVFDVPAVNRGEDKVEPADPPSEVRVDW